MSTLLAVALAALLLVLCAIREPTPDARTPAQLRTAIRRAGWWRCTGRALLLGVVPGLYVTAAVCWMCWHTLRGAGFVCSVLALRLADLGTPAGLEAA
jgi:hypothetical protein